MAISKQDTICIFKNQAIRSVSWQKKIPSVSFDTMTNDDYSEKPQPLAPDWVAPAKARMRELRLRQDELTTPFEVSTRGAIGHYFTGRRKASVDQLLRLAAFLDLNFEMLTRGRLSIESEQALERLERVADARVSNDINRNDLADIDLEEVLDAGHDCSILLNDLRSRLLLMERMYAAMGADDDHLNDNIEEKELRRKREVAAAFYARISESKNLLEKVKMEFNAIQEIELDVSEEDILKAKTEKRAASRQWQLEEEEIRSGQVSLVPTSKMVPVISWVAAGSWHEAIDLHEPGNGDGYLPCPTPHSSESYALRVEGDSMTASSGKSYPHGSIIFVDPEKRGGVVPGDRVIAKLAGVDQVTFKQLAEDREGKFLKPLNTSHQSIYGEFTVLGKVIGKWEAE